MKKILIAIFLLSNFMLEWCFENKKEETKLLYKSIKPITSETTKTETWSQMNLKTWYIDSTIQESDPRKTVKNFFNLLNQCKTKEASSYMLLWDQYYQNFENEVKWTWKTVEQICLEKKEETKVTVKWFTITWANDEWVIVDVELEKSNKKITVKIPMVKIHNERYIIQEKPEYKEEMLTWSNSQKNIIEK